MKIIYTISSSTIGGAEVYISNLAVAIEKKGHSCLIVCPEGKMVSEYRKKGLRVEILPLRFDIDPWYISSLRRILDRENADLLHTNLLKASVNGLIAGFLARTPVKIVHTHDILYDWKIPWQKRKINITVNSFICNQLADTIIASNEQMKHNLSVKDKLKSDKITVISNGIDIDRFATNADKTYLFRKYGWNSGSIRIIGMVGRLSSEKGCDILIKAAQKILSHKEYLDAVRFVLIGEGEKKSKYETMVNELELSDYIKFPGILYGEDEVKALHSLSVFVSCSFRETFGLSVAEAMAAKIPLVVSNLEVYNEVCPNGNCSLHAQSGDANDFAEKIILVLGNRSLQERLTQTAQARVCEKYSLEDFINNHLALYTEQLKKKT